MKRDDTDMAGFTIVELIVVIIVATTFIVAISQAIGSVGSSAAQGTWRTVASNLAYNNLRIYANGEKPRWFNCSGDEASDTAPYSDGTKAGATGQVLINTTSSTSISGLPAPVVQKVFAIAPYGCGVNETSPMPIRIQSEVTYGSPGKTLVHATYVSY